MWVFIRKTKRNCTGRILHGSSEGQGVGGSWAQWEGLCRGLRRGRKATHAVPAPWSRPAQPPPPRLEFCPALWADSRRHSPTSCVQLLWKSLESQKNVQWSECAETEVGSKQNPDSSSAWSSPWRQRDLWARSHSFAFRLRILNVQAFRRKLLFFKGLSTSFYEHRDILVNFLVFIASGRRWL